MFQNRASTVLLVPESSLDCLICSRIGPRLSYLFQNLASTVLSVSARGGVPCRGLAPGEEREGHFHILLKLLAPLERERPGRKRRPLHAVPVSFARGTPVTARGVRRERGGRGLLAVPPCPLAVVASHPPRAVSSGKRAFGKLPAFSLGAAASFSLGAAASEKRGAGKWERAASGTRGAGKCGCLPMRGRGGGGRGEGGRGEGGAHHRQ